MNAMFSTLPICVPIKFRTVTLFDVFLIHKFSKDESDFSKFHWYACWKSAKNSVGFQTLVSKKFDS